MNEINKNSNEIDVSTNIIINNISSESKNDQYKKAYQNMNHKRKNKSTQLFETLLGSKLILTENSNMLIEKPFTIFEILDIFQSDVELEVKMEIIEKLNMIILKHHINSAIIMEKSTLKDSKSEIKVSFLNELIKILIYNSREPKLIEDLLKLLEILNTKFRSTFRIFLEYFSKNFTIMRKK